MKTRVFKNSLLNLHYTVNAAVQYDFNLVLLDSYVVVAVIQMDPAKKRGVEKFVLEACSVRTKMAPTK